MVGVPIVGIKAASQVGLLRSQIGKVMPPVGSCIVDAAEPRQRHPLSKNQNGRFGYWREQET